MNLFLFAHRGEAQSFIKHFDFRPEAFFLNGLFINQNNDFLLITGEGFKEANEKVLCFLSIHQGKVKSIFNIGIAGSLNPKYKKNECFWVRSSIAYNSDKCEFKTYQSFFHQSVDCLTSYSRVLDYDEKRKLSFFADLVDRELYAISSAAHLFKIPFFSLKMISDNITFEGHDQNFCDIIQNEAEFYSDSLLEKFLKDYTKLDEKRSRDLKLIKRSTSGHLVTTTSLQERVLNDKRFHFTVALERKVSQIIAGLEVKNKLNSDLLDDLIEHFFASKSELTSPKDNAKEFAQFLNDYLNPFNMEVKKRLDQLLSVFSESGINAYYDQELEDPTVLIQLKIRSTKDLKKAQFALDQFKYYKVENLFNGKIEDDV